MQFTLTLPTDRVDHLDEFVSAEAIHEIASAAERLGYGAIFVTEHPIPNEEWLDTGGHHALDPFVALSFAACATKKIRLLTNLIVLAYKNPFLTAKSAASLDHLSQGRLTLGVGAGYLEAEFRALERDFSRRNELCDEALVTLKKTWSGEAVSIVGEDGKTTLHRSLPCPLQKPHPPIWMGGNSKRAIRRVVDHGQGWMPFQIPAQAATRTRTAAIEGLDDLRMRINYLYEHAQQVGREGRPDIVFGTMNHGFYGQADFSKNGLLDEIEELRELGITWTPAQLELSGSHTIRSRSEYLDLMEGFASDIISQVN